MTSTDEGFDWADPSDGSNTIFVTPHDGGVIIKVADEVAVGSYNDEFELGISLPRERVLDLIAYLQDLLDV